MATELIEKQNITLSIPKSLLRKAKIIAAERQTSLSKLMVEALMEIVEKSDSYEQARRRHLAWLEHGADLGFEGKIPWSREELHER